MKEIAAWRFNRTIADAIRGLAVSGSRVGEEASLTKRLVKDDRHGVGEVEAADTGLENRDAICRVAPGGEKVRTESFGLAAEDQEISPMILSRDVVFVAVS